MLERIREEAEETGRLPTTLTVAWRHGPTEFVDGQRVRKRKSSRTSRSVSMPPLPSERLQRQSVVVVMVGTEGAAEESVEGFVSAGMRVLVCFSLVQLERERLKRTINNRCNT